MTQRQIAEQILRRLKKFTDESDIDEREISLAVNQSLASLVRNRYFASKADETGEVDGSLYYSLKNNLVDKDEDTGYYYTSTPAPVISLPFGIDINRVWTKNGRGFIEVPRGFLDLYSTNESIALGGNIGFYREANKLYFVNMTSANKPENVNVSMVLPFSRIDEDDEIFIPLDMVNEVIEDVFNKFAKTLQIPTDETNDSNDN